MSRLDRLVLSGAFLFTIVCLGCGSSEDFSKPTATVRTQPVAAKATKKAEKKEASSETPEVPPGKTKQSSAAKGKSKPVEEAEPLPLDLKWLIERDQHTAISNGSRLLAVGGRSGSLRTFDVTAGTISQLFPEQPEGLSALTVNSVGTELATATSDGQVRFWSNVAATAGLDEYRQLSLRNDPRQRGYGAHLGGLTALEYHPEAKGFATAGIDGTVKVWQYPPTPPLAVALGEFGHTTIAIDSNNGTAATVTADGEFSLWNIEKQEKLRSFLGNDAPYTRLLFLPDSDALLAGSESGVITAMRSKDGVVFARLLGHQGAINALQLANEGQAVLSADVAGDVRLWNLPLTSSTQIAKFTQPVESLRRSPDQRFGAALLKDKSMMLFEVRGSGKPRKLAGKTTDVRVFEFSNDSTLLGAGTTTGTLRLWSVATNQVLGDVSVQDSPVRSLLFHPKEQLVAIGAEDGRVRLIDWTAQVSIVDRTPVSASWVRSSPDGKVLASIDFNGDLRIWIGDEPKPVAVKSLANFGVITSLAVSNTLIGVANQSGEVLFVSPREVTREERLQVSDLGLIELGFDPAGESVIGLEPGGSVRSAWIPCMFLSTERKQEGVGVTRRDFEALSRLERSVTSLAPDGSWFARSLPGNRLQLQSMNAADKPVELKLDAMPSHLAIAAGGKAVAVTIGKEVRVLDPTGKVIERIKLDREGSTVSFRGQTMELASPIQKQSQGPERRLDLKFDGSIDALAANSDGKLLAVGVSNGAVRLVMMDTGEEVAKFDADRAGIMRLAFSSDDKYLLCTTHDQRALQWQLETKELVSQTNLGGAALDASVTSEGHSIAVFGADHSMRLVAASTAGTLQEFELAPPQIAIPSDVSAKPKTPAKVESETSSITSVQATTSGGAIWLGGSDGSVWEHFPAATRVLRPHGDQGLKDAILVTRDTYLASVSQDDVVAIHQLSGQLIRRFEGHDGKVIGIVAVNNGTQIAAAIDQAGKGKLFLWSIADGQQIGKLPLGSVPHRLIRDEDGLRFVLLDRQKRLHVYDSETAHLRERIESIEEVVDGVIASQLDSLLATEGDGGLRLYPCQIQKLMPGLTEPATTIEWSPDGTQLMAGTNGRLMVWDVKSGRVTLTLKVGPTAVTSTCLSDTGHFCVAGQDGSVRIWDLKTLLEQKEAAEPQTVIKVPGAVFALAFSPDGRQLATGGQESLVRIWEAATGRELAQLFGHVGPIQSLKFDSTQDKLLSTGVDRSARVWDLAAVKAGIGNSKAPPAKISSAVSSISNLSASGSELHQTLEKELGQSKDEKSRARVRGMIKQVEIAKANAGKTSKPAETNVRTEILRMTLRQATSPQAREKIRQQLLISLREDDLRRSLNAARTDAERREIRKSLEAIRNSRRFDAVDNALSDAEIWHRLDRKQIPADADEKLTLKSEMDELAKTKPIWPRGVDAAKPGNSRSHLLSTIPTNFEFDSKVFRRVELALSSDELSLGAARESAALRNDRRVEGVVRIWDVPSRTEMRSWNEVENGSLKAIQFDPNGQSILTIPDVFGFELSTGTSRAVARAATVSLSPDGQLALLGHRGRERELGDAVSLLDLTSLESRPARFQAYESTVPALAMSPDGRTIAASIRERAKHRLLLLDAESLTIKRVLEEFTHKDSWIDPTNGQIPGITLIHFSPDGQYLIAYGQYAPEEYRLTSYQVKDGKAVASKKYDTALPRRDSLRPFVFVKGKSLIAVETIPALVVVDLKENRTVREIPWNESANGRRVHAITNDGSTLAFGDAAGVVELFRLDREEEPVAFRAHEGPTVGIAFSPSDHTLITAGEENQIRLWTLSAFHNTRAPTPGKNTPKKRPK